MAPPKQLGTPPLLTWLPYCFVGAALLPPSCLGQYAAAVAGQPGVDVAAAAAGQPWAPGAAMGPNIYVSPLNTFISSGGSMSGPQTMDLSTLGLQAPSPQTMLQPIKVGMCDCWKIEDGPSCLSVQKACSCFWDGSTCTDTCSVYHHKKECEHNVLQESGCHWHRSSLSCTRKPPDSSEKASSADHSARHSFAKGHSKGGGQHRHLSKQAETKVGEEKAKLRSAEADAFEAFERERKEERVEHKIQVEIDKENLREKALFKKLKAEKLRVAKLKATAESREEVVDHDEVEMKSVEEKEGELDDASVPPRLKRETLAKSGNPLKVALKTLHNATVADVTNYTDDDEDDCQDGDKDCVDDCKPGDKDCVDDDDADDPKVTKTTSSGKRSQKIR